MSGSDKKSKSDTPPTKPPGDPDCDEVSKPHRIDVPDDEFGEGFDDKRLWVGNLDSKFTEFAMLKLAQKYGKVRKFDFIYHKGGSDKGVFKGYGFVSFHTWEAAELFRKNMDGKLVLGKTMHVKWAHGSIYTDKPGDQTKDKGGPSTPQSVDTALAAATLPSGSSLTSASPMTKIQAIEAKLKMMKASQKDFSVNQRIQAHPGYNQYAMQNKKDNRRGGRSAPYNRKGHRFNSRR